MPFTNTHIYMRFILNPSIDSTSSEQFLKGSFPVWELRAAAETLFCSQEFLYLWEQLPQRRGINLTSADLDGCKGGKKFSPYLSHAKAYMLHTGQKDNS